ncbi:GNAT family N-acetyltransferase [Nakamurella antarctica]|uniref:GNAT family N-acetyltransferase n=1 Tax=Nakamurella antarctica TaxID=1902245 RepID=A0A3G8ZNQ6_9ACTN|nr:GNAT family N-acetyltransferase [Nakamurella antarctica]AZI58929.1 GNAT family N-acetyltransferase [Nakamurella antarctica]
MVHDIRTITDDELPAWTAAVSTGFFRTTGDAGAELRRAWMELDRTWGAFDGAEIAATARSFPTSMTVPGGNGIDVSALTAVTTTSTHRRRGLASRLVHADLVAAKERGEIASVLIAAEWPIYGRFGFGPSTESQRAVIDARAGRLREPIAGSVEFIERAVAREIVPPVYDGHRVRYVGEIQRLPHFWDLELGVVVDPAWPAPKAGFFVRATDGDGASGLVSYSYEDKEKGRVPASEVTVNFMFAPNPTVEALLWQHLLALDLVATITVGEMPADSVLPWLLTDGRHVQFQHRSDFHWLRPLDVPKMLTSRAFHASGSVVLEIIDSLGFTGGRYALDATPSGATCVATTASADLTMGVAACGSLYLGGHRLRTLAAAGLIDVHSQGAADVLDSLLHSPTAPFSATWF